MFEANDVSEATIAAFFEALDRFALRPDLTAIDIGFPEVGGFPVWNAELVVRMHVRKKQPTKILGRAQRLPSEISGVLTDVVEAEYVLHGDGSRLGVQTPLRPGVSIGHQSGATGTLGMFVRDRRSGALCVASASHVLAPAGAAVGPTSIIFQPGPNDPAPRRPIAHLSRFDGEIDAAIAELAAGETVDTRIHDTTARITRVTPPRAKTDLVKTGRTTGETTGRVDSVGGHYGVVDGFRLKPLVPMTSICEGGDSGAVWYDPTAGSAVGLHCAGPPSGGAYAVATSIESLLDRLEVEIVQGNQITV